jgi:hypothetical protein
MAGGPGTLTDGGSGSQTTTVFDQFDLTKKENFSAYLNAVQNKAQAGEVLDAQDVTTAKALLYHYFGYPMGALKSDPSSDAAVRDQLRADLSETITNLSSQLCRHSHDRMAPSSRPATISTAIFELCIRLQGCRQMREQ